MEVVALRMVAVEALEVYVIVISQENHIVIVFLLLLELIV